MTLAVKASLEVTVGLEPRSVEFGNVHRDEKATRVVKLVGRDAEKTKVLSATFKPLRAAKGRGAADKTVVQTKVMEAGSSGAVEVSLAPDAPSGLFNGQLVVQTDHPETPQVVVLVRGMVHGAVSVRPPRLIFKGIQYGVAQTQTLTITGNGDQPVDVLEVENDHPALTTTVSKAAGGSTEITVTCDGKIDRPASTRLTIRTSSSEDPQVVAPVAMYPDPRGTERSPARTKSAPTER